MRLDVVKQIDAETREVWSFNLTGFNVIFVWWSIETKPKRKHNWTIEECWDAYGRSTARMVKEPVLPESIRNEALLEVMKYIRVRTWDEWKLVN